MTRILIADDHAVVRAGLRELLLQRGSFSVVGEARVPGRGLQPSNHQPPLAHESTPS